MGDEMQVDEDAPGDFQAVTRLEKELQSESDRGAILIAAAMLDEALRDLLLTQLVPNPGSSDPLFEGLNGPLYSFSSKIDMSFRLGLISGQLCRDLHLIRKMRNDVAHAPSGCSFKDHSTVQRVSALNRSHGIFQRSPKWAFEKAQEPRSQFVETASWMLYALTVARKRITAWPARHPEFGYMLKLDSD